MGATRPLNGVTLGTWIVASVLAIVGTNIIGNAAGLGWLPGLGGILVLAFWIVPAGYCLAMGRSGTVARVLLIPLTVMVCGTTAWVVWLRARIGPDRDLFRGVAHLRAGRLEQAVVAFDRHLQRKPLDLAGLANATLSLLELARHEEALGYLDAALNRSRSTEVLALRALVLSSTGATDEALRDIDEAIAERPKNSAYHYYRAVVLSGGGRIDQALEVLKGPASPTKCPNSWYLLGVSLPSNGEAGDAADACRRALPVMRAARLLGPTPWSHIAEAWLFVYLGKLDPAERAIARTAARCRDESDPPAVQALIYTLRGRIEDALQSLERTERGNPFLVVEAARNPRFAPLVTSPGFPALLERATRDWQARLAAIRDRPGIAQSGA